MRICGRGRIGGNEGFLGFGSNDLDVDVIGSGEEETLADREVGETLLFFLGEFKYVRKSIDGRGRLFK